MKPITVQYFGTRTHKITNPNFIVFLEDSTKSYGFNDCSHFPNKIIEWIVDTVKFFLKLIFDKIFKMW